MNIYAAHQPEIDAAWSTVEREIDALPASLAALGRWFLASIGAGSAGHRDYFSSEISPPLLYLPLWLRDRFHGEGRLSAHAPSDPAPHAVLAGMWGYFYVRIQDDVVDAAEGRDLEMLLFANVCCSRMYASLAAATALTLGYWPAFERAWTDFTRWTLEEHRWMSRSEPYPAELFEAQASKVSFARIPALAVCFAAGQRELEPLMTRLIHQLGVAYGLVNDVLGWPRDLRTGQRTYLLARAGLTQDELEACSARALAVGSAHNLEHIEERLRRSLYEEGLLCDVLDEAEQWHRRADETAAHLRLPSFVHYTAERVEWLEGQRRRIDALQVQRALARTCGSHAT